MSEIDDYFDDDIDAAAFDAVVTAATSIPSTRDELRRTAAPPRPSQNQTNSSIGFTQRKYIQPTIFGASQVPAKSSRQPKPTSSQYHPPLPKATQQQPRVKTVKKWDKLNAIKVLPSVIQNDRKKRRSRPGDEDEDDEMDDEGFDSDTDLLIKALQEEVDLPSENTSIKLQSDPMAIKTWIYSTNKPKRKYQYDIVARALYNNCLVSLPTGLGKTFIAAVVMLNFYRWFPKGKVIFLAPTRPLVQQQIEACHSIAGIPSIDCVSLTGTTSASKRADAWQQKRVIFATPQTVANDLRRGSVRPEDVICVVVDEAHRATGAYAYCVVVRLLMRFNPHFRVLALTATPGSDPDRVQAVIDNLHIGHIEVRTEESMDIRPYTKHKEIVLEKIPLTPELISIRDKWGKLMLPLIKQCESLFHGSKDPAYIHAFSITSAQMQLSKERSYLRPNLAVLCKMATAMSKLLEYSISLAYEKMLELKQEPNKCARGVCSQVGYKSLMTEIGQLTTSPGFTAHPKMEKMKALTIEFFVNAQDQGKTSRAMVFCHFRDMVTDIVCYLNQEKPLINASAFIGQSNDVRGNRGMNQKTQNEVIQRFKNNEFNVLVATSIGEEGLDIGALDFIICYEAQKSPLRMLQRLGRTGRNEDGKVIVLIAEGREDKNWEKAQDQYQHVQNALLSQKVLEVYGDCERLVPEGTRPVPLEQTIDVQPLITEQIEIDVAASGRRNKGKSTKRKRPGIEDIPAGALLGFVSAKNYQVPKSKAEAFLERTKAALLSVDEAATLKQQWSRNTASTIQPPIDPQSMDIHFCPTNSPLGSKLAAIPSNRHSGRNITPSSKYSALMSQCQSFVEDDVKYEAWRKEKIDRLDAKDVIWWPEELRGTGIRRPLRLCADRSRSILRHWMNEQPHVAPDASTYSELQQSSNLLPFDNPSEPGNIRQISSPGRSRRLSQKDDSLSPASELPEIDDIIPPSIMHKKPFTSSPSGGLLEIDDTIFTAMERRLLPPSSPIAPLKKVKSVSTVTEPDQSNGFKRLAAFKNSAHEPPPFVPELSLGARRPQEPTLASSLKPLYLHNKQHQIESPSSSELSLHEPVPDSEPEVTDQRLPVSSNPQQAMSNEKCRMPQSSPGVDEDSSAGSSFNQVILNSDSETHPRRLSITTDPRGEPVKFNHNCTSKNLKIASRTVCLHGNPESTGAPGKDLIEHFSNSDDQFEDLDPQTLNALDQLEQNLNQFHTREISDDSKKPPMVSSPVPSSPNDNFPELDHEALAALEDLETRLTKPSYLSEEPSRKSPVTPSALPGQPSISRKSSLTSQLYEDHSPLLFRSLPRNKQPQIGLSEYENGDNFLDPSSILAGTQMPRSRRVPRGLAYGNAGTMPSKTKRVIAEESDEEVEHAENNQDRELGSKSNRTSNHTKNDTSPFQPNLPVQSKGKRKQSNYAKRNHAWALKSGLFDLEAGEADSSVTGEENDDGDGRQQKRRKKKRRKGKIRRSSSEEEIESENSIDRDFLVNTSSSSNMIKDNCSPDKSMSSFYRASILMMSQPLSVVKKKLEQASTSSLGGGGHQVDWNQNRFTRHQAQSTSTHYHRPQSSDDHHFPSSSHLDNDQFSFDSFCVPDEATIEYEDNQDETLSSQV